jgi:hypothetical protein
MTARRCVTGCWSQLDTVTKLLACLCEVSVDLCDKIEVLQDVAFLAAQLCFITVANINSNRSIVTLEYLIALF